MVLSCTVLKDISSEYEKKNGFENLTGNYEVPLLTPGKGVHGWKPHLCRNWKVHGPRM